MLAAPAVGRVHFQQAAEELYALTKDDSVVPGPELSTIPDSDDDVHRRKTYWEERTEEAVRCAVAGRRYMTAVAPTQVRFTVDARDIEDI